MIDENDIINVTGDVVIQTGLKILARTNPELCNQEHLHILESAEQSRRLLSVECLTLLFDANENEPLINQKIFIDIINMQPSEKLELTSVALSLLLDNDLLDQENFESIISAENLNGEIVAKELVKTQDFEKDAIPSAAKALVGNKFNIYIPNELILKILHFAFSSEKNIEKHMPSLLLKQLQIAVENIKNFDKDGGNIVNTKQESILNLWGRKLNDERNSQFFAKNYNTNKPEAEKAGYGPAAIIVKKF